MTAVLTRRSTGASRPLFLALLLIGMHASGLAQTATPRSIGDLTMVCAGCHNPDPGTLAPDEAKRIPRLGGQQRDYLESALQAYRTRQRDHFYMRGMALGLRGDDLQRVLDHLAAPEPTQKGVQATAAPRPQAAVTCVACHGDQAQSPITTSTPRLAGQHAPYIEQAYMAYATGKRNHPVMTAQARTADGRTTLDAQALQDVAKWFSGLAGLENR